MPVITNIADLSQTAALNGPDGAVDPPSTLDDQIRYLGAFIAQLRDGTGISYPAYTPAGTMVMWAGPAAPSGWLMCNGAAVSRTTYATLFANIGTAWGVGNGSTTFNLPDMRGAFPRGVDAGRGLDPGRTLGSFQAQTFQLHNHGVNDPTHAHGIADPGHNHGLHDPGHVHSAWTDVQGVHAHTVHLQNVGGGVGLGSTYYVNQAVIAAGPYNIGSDTSGGHGHNVGIGGSGTGIWLDGSGTGIGIYGNGTGITIQSAGSTDETRPDNAAVNFIIRAQ